MAIKKSTFLAVIAAAFTASFLLVNFEQDLSAQQQQNPQPRYQISAWGHAESNGKGSTYGVYIIDTQSGQLWHKERLFPLKNLGNVND